MQDITKQELRQKIKIELSQNKQNLKKWSKLICKNIINSDFYKKAKIVYAYMALPDEVDLSFLIDDALCKNKTVFVPKVVPNSNKMIFFDYSKCQFENGSFGILEPKTNNTNEDLAKDFMEERIKNMVNDAWKVYKQYLASRSMAQLNKDMESLITKYDCQQDIKDLMFWFAARVRGILDEQEDIDNGKRN